MADFNTQSFVLYDTAIQGFLNGTQDWDSDGHFVLLLDASYTPSPSHSTLSDVVSHEITDSDYTRQTMSGEVVILDNGVSICDADDVGFGSSVTISAAYVVIVVTGSDLLVGYLQLSESGSNISSHVSNFQISWNNDYGIFTTVSNSHAFEFTALRPVLSMAPTPPPSFGVLPVDDIPVVGSPQPALATDQTWDGWIDVKYEADYGVDMSGSSKTWAPIESPHAHFILASASSYGDPTFDSNVGGYPAIHLQGIGAGVANRCMMRYGQFTTGTNFTSAQPITYALVIKPIDTSSTIFTWHENGNVENLIINANGDWELSNGGAPSIVGGAATTDRQLVVYQLNGDKSWLYVNGTLYTGEVGTNGASYISLGKSSNTLDTNFYIHALYWSKRFYPHLLPALESYCNTRWGL